MSRSAFSVAGRRLVNFAQRRATSSQQQATKMLDHIDFAKCKSALKDFNSQQTAASQSSSETAWAKIIPMKDPQDYKEMVRQFNNSRQ
mmetsp:Transcript_24325/g.48707  ORF Transcript_24325/g.48707 Transcript_24325/m.48707 type:complete len:88 (-) Transcript_24325:107-370(-)